MKLIDAGGCEHQPISMAGGQAPPRIVSLVPSITELLCDLGLAQWLAGRTGFCVHPAQTVRHIAKVGGTKTVNIGKIRALAPTHLIVNIDENEKPTVDLLAQFIPHVIVTHPLAPRDNLALYRLLGGIFGAQQAAGRLCGVFEQEYDAVVAQAASARPRNVLYCIWKDPWMTVSTNTYIAQMLALIGWRNWSGGAPERYPRFAWSEPLLDAVDEVLLSSEPYRFDQTHADALERQIGKPVRLVDGGLISWYGSRAIGGLRYLRQLAAEN